jgi:MoxR-like ATPase
MSEGPIETVAEHAAVCSDLINEVGKVLVGQEAMVTRLVMGLLTGGHVLLEGVPGLAKTLAVRCLARAIDTGFSRIQFTPDMLPADVIGTQVFNPREATYSVKKGPIFSNLILADEINRAPAKVQSALLEAMQEGQATIGDQTYPLDELFLVLATQNPIEQEGTYPLPEAQIDRFMLKVLVDYPSDREEMVIVQRMTGELAEPRQMLTTGELMALQRQADSVYVDPELMEYAVRLVGATRRPAEHGLSEIARYVSFGASPRASINLILASRALALTRGRDYVVPHDIVELAPDVLRHRVVLSYEALADRVSADDLIERVIESVPRPARPFTDDPRLTPAGHGDTDNGEPV